MKIKILFSIILALLFTSCQKDIVFVEGSGPGGTPPKTIKTSMKAKVDGVWVECEFAYAQEYINSDGKKDLQINGIKAPQAFIFNWQDFKGVGTYNAADLISSANYTNGITDPFTQTYYAESGTIKVTTYNSKAIIGTFEFKAANTVGEIKTITEGQFIISLEPTPGPTPGQGTANMSAKVDGASLNFVGQANLNINAKLGNMMTIYGTNGLKVVTIIVYNYKGAGTYEIDIDAQGGYNEDQTQTGSYASETGVKTGKLIITSSTSNTVKGTFEFVAPNMDTFLKTKKTITEGKFDVSYTTTSI
ncbi:hypothetical protein EZ428_10405 [Pedobacter frigiditerrae]|uniref:Lipocalin-like domain-containing protein n=1 Tax=Pedobacter frigiditerrae TaxID=2530452 RepID=A0A4R0N1H3_9SPHI|nr:hypothetical protein [Pedobacter frigiditerrae]TCC92134.1 hypothetical protein EZ428_10405 [Pedobacter frigiditerrae]